VKEMVSGNPKLIENAPERPLLAQVLCPSHAGFHQWGRIWYQCPIPDRVEFLLQICPDPNEKIEINDVKEGWIWSLFGEIAQQEGWGKRKPEIFIRIMDLIFAIPSRLTEALGGENSHVCKNPAGGSGGLVL